jgi:Galactose-3-O-sulfotransferase
MIVPEARTTTRTAAPTSIRRESVVRGERLDHRKNSVDDHQQGSREEKHVGIGSGGFLTGPLLELVSRWDAASISNVAARRALWEIVSQPKYMNHRPSHRIVFVKTHKTGSSTLTSVLHSIATAHNLITPITTDTRPYEPQNHADYHILTLNTTHPNVSSAPYDIWCNHVLYDNLLTEQVVPSSQNRVVTIVRDPVIRMRSACQHYRCCPSQYDDPTVFERFEQSPKGQSFFGRRHGTDDHCHVDKSSREIVGTGLYPNKTFDENFLAILEKASAITTGDFLILVTERMIESMLVLWHTYQLHPLDVAYLSKKVVRTTSAVEKSNRTLVVEHMVRTWNPYDTKMHTVANEVLAKRMELIFPEPDQRIRAHEQLQSLNDLLFSACQVDDDQATEELEYWCNEKVLDSYAWNVVHLNRLQQQRT